MLFILNVCCTSFYIFDLSIKRVFIFLKNGNINNHAKIRKCFTRN
jgi:hypothetical protein